MRRGETCRLAGRGVAGNERAGALALSPRIGHVCRNRRDKRARAHLRHPSGTCSSCGRPIRKPIRPSTSRRLMNVRSPACKDGGRCRCRRSVSRRPSCCCRQLRTSPSIGRRRPGVHRRCSAGRPAGRRRSGPMTCRIWATRASIRRPNGGRCGNKTDRLSLDRLNRRPHLSRRYRPSHQWLRRRRRRLRRPPRQARRHRSGRPHRRRQPPRSRPLRRPLPRRPSRRRSACQRHPGASPSHGARRSSRRPPLSRALTQRRRTRRTRTLRQTPPSEAKQRRSPSRPPVPLRHRAGQSVLHRRRNHGRRPRVNRPNRRRNGDRTCSADAATEPAARPIHDSGGARVGRRPLRVPLCAAAAGL